MRYCIALFCVVFTLAAGHVARSETLHPTTIEVEEIEQSPNTPGGEQGGDTSHTNRDLALRQRFIFYFKDRNEFCTDVNLDYVRLWYDTGTGQTLIAHYDPPTNEIIANDWWAALWDIDLRTLNPPPQMGGTLALFFEVRFQNRCTFQWYVNRYHLRIHIAPALPSLSGWYAVDPHTHLTYYTDDVFEFGGSPTMIAPSMDVLGMHGVFDDAHSYDVNQQDWNGLVLAAQNASSATRLVRAASETNCRSFHSSTLGLHHLALGINNRIPAPAFGYGEINGTLWTQEAVLDSIDAHGGTPFAAHPFEAITPLQLNTTQFESEDIATFRAHEGAGRWQIWNTGRTSQYVDVSEDEVNPFPFPADPQWDNRLLLSIGVVDSLRKSEFGSGTTQVIPLSYGQPMSLTDSRLLSDFIPPNRAGFLWVELRTAGGFRVYTNPIWIRSNPTKDFWYAASDAHQDYNMHLELDPTGGIRAHDGAFGKAFTWVQASALTESAIIAELRDGRCSKTNGPLGFIELDADGNGSYEIPMGGSALNPIVAARLRIRGESTTEFGGFIEARVQVFSTDNPIGVGTEEAPVVPLTLRIAGNPTSHLRAFIALPAETDVELALFDLAGREVKRFITNQRSGGTTWIEWGGILHDGSRLPSGTYFFRLTAGKERRIEKVTIVR